MLPISSLWAEYKWGAMIAALVACYAWGRYDGGALADASVLREDAIVVKAIAAARTGTAEEIAKLEIKNVTIQQRIERETREVPVYRDCRHSAPGLRSLNDALENRPLAPGAGQLPADVGSAAGR